MNQLYPFRYYRLAIMLAMVSIYCSGLHGQQLIEGLSQNTNSYIDQIANSTYISSVNGLNIFDGKRTRTFNSSTSDLVGNNIQSNFYYDDEGLVWFCTYQGLNSYDPRTNEITPFQLEIEGKVFDNNYRIFDLVDDKIWLFCQGIIVEFDVATKKVVHHFKVSREEAISCELSKNDDVFTFSLMGERGLLALKYDTEDKIILDSFEVDISLYSSLTLGDSMLVTGSFDGELLLIDHKSKRIVSSIWLSKNPILSIDQSLEKDFYVSSYEKFYRCRIDLQNAHIDTFSLSSEYEFNRLSTVYQAQDKTLWFSDEGVGVSYENEMKRKFGLFRDENFASTSITSISKIPDSKNVLATTKDNGIYELTFDGEEVYHFPFNTYDEATEVYGGVMLEDGKFLSFSNGYSYLINLRSRTTTKVVEGQMPLYVIDISRFKDELFFIDYSSNIRSLKVEEESISYDTRFSSGNPSDFYGSLEKLNDSLLVASLNQSEIQILKYNSTSGSLYLEKSLKIDGGFKSVCEGSGPDLVYVSNLNGLVEINLTNYSFSQITGPADVFLQNIYAIEKVDDERYYLSTNQGLYFWNPQTDSVHQFTMSDGLQGLEFNTDAHFQDEDGRLFFGGVNGLNVFHPDSIKLMDHEAPVMLTEYMLDDTVSTAFGMPHYVSEMELPYSQNTISFTFHALDYSGMEDARVKYMLEGYDNEFLYSKDNIGSVRYPNLPPGNYTFSIVGANADKVWNKTTRDVEIIIHPPYWQTWWFRLLALLFIGGIVYLVFRSYYTRKLREKDFKLKEQELIIAKQNALQAERNRIAGEMHDDLGGGLTTIRYLSQRIKGKLKDEKSEKQLLKIIDHSKDLVSNMSEIIWAMNSGFDRLDSLIAYTRRYSKEYLETYSIAVDFSNNVPDSKIVLTGEIRRNIFLVCKEILHNVAKHAQATEVTISFDIIDNSLRIELSDNGIGLQETNVLGNGLKTMESRMKVIEGKISRVSKNGLSYQLEIPLDKLKE